MNIVAITGRWTRDPEITTTANTTIAKGSIAVDRRFKKDGEPDADFPSVVAFGKTAEHIEKYHHKGTKAEIRGHIQTGSYEKDGKKVYTTDIIIDEIGFAESKAAQNQSGILQEGKVEDGEFIRMDPEATAEAETIFNY